MSITCQCDLPPHSQRLLLLLMPHQRRPTLQWPNSRECTVALQRVSRQTVTVSVSLSARQLSEGKSEGKSCTVCPPANHTKTGKASPSASSPTTTTTAEETRKEAIAWPGHCYNTAAVLLASSRHECRQTDSLLPSFGYCRSQAAAPSSSSSSSPQH